MQEKTNKIFHYIEFIVILFLFLLPVIIPTNGGTYWSKQNQTIDVNFSFETILSASLRCIILLLLCFYHNIFSKDLKHEKKTILYFFCISICIFLLILIPSILISYFFDNQQEKTSINNIFVTIFAVILFASQEELLFRFYIPETCKQLNFPKIKTVEVLTIMLFGLSHHTGGVATVLFATYSGVLLRLLAIKTRKNPLFSIAVHCLYNIIIYCIFAF